MKFSEVSPGETFCVLDIPKVDKYTALSVFQKYGPSSKKRCSNANAIDMGTGKEYEFTRDENVEYV